MDKNTFFSEKNTDLIFTICRDEVIKKTQYNIGNNKKYFKTFSEIMKIVHKHCDNKNDLTILNNKTIRKTIPYLVGEIKKKQLKDKPLLPRNNILNAPSIKQETLANSNGIPVSFRSTATNGNKSLQSDFNRVVKERESFHDIPTNMSLTVEDNTTYQDPSILLEQQMQERGEITNGMLTVDEQHKPNLEQKMKTEMNSPRIQKTLLETKSVSKNLDLNLQSFDLNEEVLGDLYGNTDMNTYNQSNDNIDPMKLFEQHMNQRTNEDSDYRKVQQDTINFEEQQTKDNKIIDGMKDHHNIRKQQEEKDFQNSLSMQLNNKMNNLDLPSIKSQMDSRIIQNLDEVIIPPTANDLELSQDNRLEEESKEYFKMKNEFHQKRNYINRENLLIINSGDRDWYNESEDRYSFQMRFRPATGDGGETGLGIDTLYKNIVSFELIRVIMAIENIIIPFDNRFFIDYKSLPYIALKIDELQPLYSGTNSRINNTFAKLLFDKDHTNEVIVNPLDSVGPNSYKNKYSRQLKRGYSSMAPMSNEKKTFYPAPLASLNRLTISMLTPYGANIKNHTDVLTVKAICFVKLSSSNLELDNSTGFPNDNINDNGTFYLEVTTKSAFSNRVFKLGDNVKFKGFDSTSTDTNIEHFKHFINREEGHYIINLELEANGEGKNEGYINKFYISPPGNINYDTGSKVGNYDISAGGSVEKINEPTFRRKIEKITGNKIKSINIDSTSGKEIEKIDFSTNIITITSHGYTDEKKLIYLAESEKPTILGLTNNNLYYLVNIDNDNFKLMDIFKNEINVSGDFTNKHYLYNYDENVINITNTLSNNDKVFYSTEEDTVIKGLEKDKIYTINIDSISGKFKLESNSSIIEIKENFTGSHYLYKYDNRQLETTNVHEFNTGEEVYYSTEGTNIKNLEDNIIYTINKINDLRFELFKDGFIVYLKSIVLETDEFSHFIYKKENDDITITNNNLKNNDMVLYSTKDPVIAGLDNNTNYYIKNIDNNNIKLSTTLNGDIINIGKLTGLAETQYLNLNLNNTGTCKVINQSLQTHFVFKVVTREDDTTQFIKPINI